MGQHLLCVTREVEKNAFSGGEVGNPPHSYLFSPNYVIIQKHTKRQNLMLDVNFKLICLLSLVDLVVAVTDCTFLCQ